MYSQSESLPNITGNWGNTYVRQNNNIRPSGAATGSNASSLAWASKNASSINDIGFNASKANPIYQDNAHIIPNSTKTKFFIKY